MARNEEKQLARLNRYYLQQQREEELKKRPPRPKLETLTTIEDVKKWLPSIMRDIDFYVKQMEVPCYPKKQIEEFERRIDHHRGEYKAFIRKLHQLQPDLKINPWTDRKYASKRKKTTADQTFMEHEKDATIVEGQPGIKDTTQHNTVNVKNFIPLSTPVLKNDSSYLYCYGFEKPTIPNTYECEIRMQNEPLQLDFEKRLANCVQQSATAKSQLHHSNEHIKGHQLEFDDTNKGPAYNVESVHFHTDNHQQNSDLMHDVSVVSSKTCRQPHLHHVNSKDQLENSSCKADFHAGTEIDENNRNCKCESGVVIQSNPVPSSNENISGISKLGTLNIPYTDSSSSDGET